MLKTLKKIFSRSCLGCGIAVDDSHAIFCPKCEYKITHTTVPVSKSIISAVSYSSPLTKKLILRAKDIYDTDVFDFAAYLLEQKLRELCIIDNLADFYITYAPRNPKKLLLKRFDQTKETADFLALRLFENDKGRVISLFKRKLFSREQKKLDIHGRINNAKGIFRLRRNVHIPEKLLILDDLTTTGSTLFTLRDIALNAGVKECLLCSVAVNDSLM